ncbi:alpha/beta hydrolase [Parasedimentitalea maritima]|uniref:Alpha/beta hydrolase n=1 Tax=Parasedimentitalea maritima TaxID=2578117 RepID=A0ABY2UPF6_9RHOB|nr:alpha/beta hydrolase [Zongyanglinia marina]TLP56546.1 alpha/beta hydrolase [Zongyanglinia marina]
MQDWDDAFANMAHVEGSDALPGIWAARAASYRENTPNIDLDIAYGSSERERFDLVHPEAEAQGLVVFVHGGFWMRLDKSYWTNLAEGARANGWAVCIPSYTLTPDVRISEITQQIGRAIAVAAQKIAGPIRLVGHSAGGHLVTRMICEDSPLPESVAKRIVHTFSLSGLHDLRPLLHTKMNETLCLDGVEAMRESAVLHKPRNASCLTAWVGGGERPEFIRQSKLLAMMWEGLDCDTSVFVEGEHNHFTVLDGLLDPTSPLCRSLLG